MNSKVKIKIMVIILGIIMVLFLCNNKVNAEFAFSEQSIEVKLNGRKDILYIGGSGNITWKSNDSSIVTVNDGTVEGKKIGTTTVTATRGEETATCTVNVVYESISIGSNRSNAENNVNLFLGEHDSEKLVAIAKDGNNETVSNPAVTWTSSDTNVVTVDKATGVIKAVKAGKATITAEAAGVSNTCGVTVYASPVFTDFSNAKYEEEYEGAWCSRLKVTGVETGAEKAVSKYYFLITSNTAKPNIEKISSGEIDLSKMKDVLSLEIQKDFMISDKSIAEYVELNQDMYLWVLQTVKLEDSYYDENGNNISYTTKFVAEAKKITRQKLQFNIVMNAFNTDNILQSEDSYISFEFPTVTANRKFSLKIGKVTDNSILSKIQKNNYEGITELLEYAKSHDSVYSQNLTTTETGRFESEKALLDGVKLLQDDAYYYIYVKFDDENGKYYPVEGVTLGQANISGTSFSLYGYTADNFKWNIVPAESQQQQPATQQPTQQPQQSTQQAPQKAEDKTVASRTLPKTGILPIIKIPLIIITVLGGFFYIGYKKLKDVK